MCSPTSSPEQEAARETMKTRRTRRAVNRRVLILARSACRLERAFNISRACVRVLFLLFIAEREREYVCFNFVMKEGEDLGAWRTGGGEKGKPKKAREKRGFDQIIYDA